MSRRPTTAQAGLWFAHQLDPHGAAGNTAEVLEIDGPVDLESLCAAIGTAVGEADGLHVRFGQDADGPLLIGPDGDPAVQVGVLDLREEGDPGAVAERWMADEVARPIDLARGPLHSQTVLRVGELRTLWLCRVHHAALDGYGFSLLLRRASEVYVALLAGEDPGPSPFRPTATVEAEEREYENSPQRVDDLAHWLSRMDGAPGPATPAGAVAPPSPVPLRRRLVVGSSTVAGLEATARRCGAGWPELTAALVAAYVGRITGTGDVILGMPLMNRMGSVALRVPTVTVNVLPLRVAPAADATLAELVQQVGAELRGLRRHGRLRGEDLRRELGVTGVDRRLHGPLVNLIPFAQALSFGQATARVRSVAAGPVDDLTVGLRHGSPDGGAVLEVDANPALYTAAELDRHAERLLGLLDHAAGAGAEELPLGELPVMGAAERRLVLEGFNATGHPVEDETLVEALAAAMADRPDATGLRLGGVDLPLAELHRRAARLARRLIAAGAGPERLVALAVPRSFALMEGLLATLQAGAAWLPIDADLPAERIAFMLADARPACVLTVAEAAGGLSAEALASLADAGGAGGEASTAGPTVLRLDAPAFAAELAGLPDTPVSDAERLAPLTPASPAYVIYTSGSTGRPKGVQVEHRAIVNRLRWMQHRFGLGPGDRVLQKTPISFDVSVWELLWPLLQGATLVLAAPGEHRDPAALAALLARERITLTHMVPSMLGPLLREPTARTCTELRAVVCSGEALGAELVARAAEVLPCAAVHNLYGPTEAAVDVTAWCCDPEADGAVVPIGRPIWNTRTYVLDEQDRPVPIGVAGQLHLAGVQLARGYLHRPELTAERFVADPFAAPGERMYRTGDLARWRGDGALEFLGRSDHQVKLRGQRLELGEIEACLARHPSVGEAVVLLRQDAPGDERLVAYVVPAAVQAVDPAELRAHAGAELPAYMVPSAVVMLAALPLTPNGKLDRGLLPAPEAAGPTGASGTSGRPPRTPREELLCGLWAEALGLDRVGIDDGFFELGGHSLLAARLAADVGEALGVRTSVAELFTAPTVAAFAERIGRGGGDDGRGALDVLLPLRAAGDGPALFCLPPAGGLGWCYGGLTRHLSAGTPVWALQARGLHAGEVPPSSLSAMASDYVQQLLDVQGGGPFHLVGWSVGGIVAHEVAVQLQAAGHEVGVLALMDAYPSEQWQALPEPTEADALLAMLHMAGMDESALGGEPVRRDVVLGRLRDGGSALAQLGDAVLGRVAEAVVRNARFMREHRHGTFDGDVTFFTAAAPRSETWLDRDGWLAHITGELEDHPLACSHPAMTSPGPLARVGQALDGRIRRPIRTRAAGM